MSGTLTAPATSPAPPAGGDELGASRPRWGRWAQLVVTAVAGVLYVANLSVNGLGNPYYAAAVKSGSVRWKALLFGSLDPGSFITVDKPPAAFWLQGLSVRVFGYSSWSMLVPDALAGAATVAVTYHLARRVALTLRDRHVRDAADGTAAPSAVDRSTVLLAEAAGVLASLALAVTPVAVVMFRFNDPDALLTFLLTVAAWAGWVAVERGSVRHLVLAGVLIGLGFDAKMLVAAAVVPGLALAWIVAAPTPLRRRLLGWLAGGAAMVVSAGWWVTVVVLWPAASRPYIGSTTDNSLVSLIFGYNGLSRIFGGHRGPAGAGGALGRSARSIFARPGAAAGGVPRPGHGAAAGPGGAFGGQAGWGRLLGSALGSQIGWLLPLAAAGLVAGLVVARRARRTDRWRAGFVLMGGWALAGFVVFSKASGIFHGYYTVAIAPPVAFLAAAGSVALWRLGEHRARSWLLPAAVIGSGAWAYGVLGRDPSFAAWGRPLVLAASVAGGLTLLAARLLPRPVRRAVTVTAVVLAAVGLVTGPAAYAADSTTHASNGVNPTAGPATAGAGGGSFAARLRGAAGGPGGAGSSAGHTAADRRFVAWLEAHRHGATYLVAVDGATPAEDLIIASGQPVMAMGGFSGTDPAPTLAQFEQLVRAGAVRYVLVPASGGRPGGFGRPRPGGGFVGSFGGLASRTGGNRGAGGSGTVGAVLSWAQDHGARVTPGSYGSSAAGTLYELTPADVR
jgi:4-amino-4-deoxy-L-arabinose transferase-like glycosyltransferase